VIRKIITISSDSTVQEAFETMNDHSTSCLIVLLEGMVIGIITDKDLVYRVVAKGLNPRKTRVQEIASKPVIVMRPETSLVTAVKVMIQKKIKKSP
jgi:CBS domain-containing protein